MSAVQRLLNAMAYIASREGYAAASVAKVIEHAGVSRATFYEHFADRSHCFLAAYREAVVKLRTPLGSAAAKSTYAERPRAVLAALLEAAARDPAAARLVLIEALAAPPLAKVEQEELILTVEDSIEDYLVSEENSASIRIPAAALLGGIAGLLSTALLRGSAASLSSQLDDLATWIATYEVAEESERCSVQRWQALGQSLLPAAPPSIASDHPSFLPRGSNAMSASSVAAARRKRIIEATALVVSKKGYAAMTVADITQVARVTRAAFYSHFRCKQDAFLAAQASAFQQGVAAAAAEFFIGDSWAERVWGGLRSLLAYRGEHPELSFLSFVEIHAAGEVALLQELSNSLAYTLFLEDGYRQGTKAERLPTLCSEAIAGAVFAMMRRQVLGGRTAEMLEILPQCAYVALAPFIGPHAAAEFVEATVLEDVRAGPAVRSRSRAQLVRG